MAAVQRGYPSFFFFYACMHRYTKVSKQQRFGVFVFLPPHAEEHPLIPPCVLSHKEGTGTCGWGEQQLCGKA